MSLLMKNLKRSLKPGASLRHVKANLLTARDIRTLKRAMGWVNDPVLDDDWIYRFENLTDLNDRRVRDVEVLGGACANGDPKILLEIGTAGGEGTAIMAKNAPNGTVYTVNILPEDIAEGGKVVSYAPAKEEIGKYYRDRGLTNVVQIYANTLRWEPDFGPIDVAYIDGCHDASFVYGDTKKILAKCRPGSIILWHDFAPELIGAYPFIKDVMRGVEFLYQEKLLRGNILHLQDSFMGIYKVPPATAP